MIFEEMLTRESARIDDCRGVTVGFGDVSAPNAPAHLDLVVTVVLPQINRELPAPRPLQRCHDENGGRILASFAGSGSNQ